MQGSDYPRISRRLTELDAMRGIAAFAVVLTHAVVSLPDQNILIFQVLRGTPLRPFVDGRAEVIFFFVLSGLILTRAFIVVRPPGYLVFAVRRVIRLCLPALAAVILSAVLYDLCYESGPWLDSAVWFKSIGWTRPPNATDILRQAFLIGTDRDIYLDGPLWSLVHELRFSLLLPVVITLAVKWDIRGQMLLLISSGVMFGLDLREHGMTMSRLDGSAISASIIDFVLPTSILLYVLSRISPLSALIGFMKMRKATLRWSLLVGSVSVGILLSLVLGPGTDLRVGSSVVGSCLTTLYFAQPFLVGVAISLGGLDLSLPKPEVRSICVVGALLLLSYDNLFASTAASTLLILVARQPGYLRRLLQIPPLVFLGQISFSLYLVHMPILFALKHGMHETLPCWMISGAMILLSVPAAWMLHRLVECPALTVSRYIGGRPGLATS